MTVYNEKPRPRVLFENAPEGVYEDLASLVPTSRLITHDEDVHESEYDLVVTWASNAARRSAELHVLAFNPRIVASVFHRNSFDQLKLREESKATEATVQWGDDSETRSLIRRTIIDRIPEKHNRFYGPVDARYQPLVELGPECEPYAFLWTRGNDPAGLIKTLVLPEPVIEYREWMVWFLTYLHDIDSRTFPGKIDWVATPSWSTAATSQLHEKLQATRLRKAEALEQLEAQERAAQTALEQAKAEDSIGLQRLLTADGEELEVAVADALRVLGFEVSKMDDHHDATTKARLEDLRIADPECADWASLVEIKGYTKGAKVSDVPQIAVRPVLSYVKEMGHEPATVWHIVNAHRREDPSARPNPLPNDVDLGSLSAVNGVLIDTRQLFLAVKDVQRGDMGALQVRQGLRAASLRWEYRFS